MHSEKRTPKKQRRSTRPGRATGKGAGERWGDGVRDRLRALIQATSKNNSAFARTCGLDAPRLSQWLAGDQLPNASHVRQIAIGTGASIDWLLLGEGGEGPVYRNQGTQSDLEVELAVAVRRHIHRRESEGAFDTEAGSIRLGLDKWIVEGGGLFRDLCAIEEERVRAWIEYEDRTEALRGVSEDIFEALVQIVPHLPDDDTRLGELVYRLGQAGREAREFRAGLGVPTPPNSFRGIRLRDLSHPVVGPREALEGVKRAGMGEIDDQANPLAERVDSGRGRFAPPGLALKWD
jgi:transcriptional regulator with XRE-family HTH domain